MLTAFDDLFIEDEPTQNADYLSTAWKLEDVRATKSYIHKRRSTLPNFRRLENALWRAWTQQAQKIPCFSSVLLRWDKESDTTWLFGPRKCSAADLSRASPRSESEVSTLSDSSEKNLTPAETGAEIPRKRSILLSSQHCQIQRPLDNKSGVFRKRRSRKLSSRVRFNDEVQQVLCLPEAVYSSTNFLPFYEAQDSIMTDAEIYHLRILLDYYQLWDHTILPLPPTHLKPTEDPYHPSFVSESDFYVDNDTADLVLC